MLATALGSTVAAFAALACDGKLVGGAEGTDAGDASADVAGDAGGGANDGGPDARDWMATPGASPAPETCDSTKPFGPGAAIDFPPLQWDAFPAAPRLLADERTMFFHAAVVEPSYNGTYRGPMHIWFATRASATGAFGPAQFLSLYDRNVEDKWPTATRDGLRLYFSSARNGSPRVWTSVRATTADNFGPPSQVSALSAITDPIPFLAPDGTALYVSGNDRIYRAPIDAAGVGSPIELPLGRSSIERDTAPVVSFDHRALYFSRVGANGSSVWIARRPDVASEFATPVLATGVAVGHEDWPTWISPGECRLYVSGSTPGFPSSRVETDVFARP